MLSVQHFCQRVFFISAFFFVSACASNGASPSSGNPSPSPTPTSAPSQLTAPLPTLPALSIPTSTPLPATPTSVPPEPIQLTTDGCCVAPTWSPDSKRVLYIDKPNASAPAGLYAVEVSQPRASPQLFTDVLGTYSRLFTYRAVIENQQTFVERVADKKRWRIDNDGRNVTISPDEKLIAWTVTDNAPVLGNRRADVYVANVDGSNARKVLSGLIGGGFSGWLNDSSGFLFSWRETLTATERIISVFALADGSAHELIRAERISNTILSTNGTWLAYIVTFSPNPANDGTIIVGLDGKTRRKLDFYGALQWRDDNRLLYIPYRASPDQSFQLYEYNVQQDQSRRVLDPAQTPLFIAGGDWRVAPDGHAIVFVSSVDRNLYLVNLP